VLQICQLWLCQLRAVCQLCGSVNLGVKRDLARKKTGLTTEISEAKNAAFGILCSLPQVHCLPRTLNPQVNLLNPEPYSSCYQRCCQGKRSFKVSETTTALHDCSPSRVDSSGLLFLDRRCQAHNPFFFFFFITLGLELTTCQQRPSCSLSALSFGTRGSLKLEGGDAMRFETSTRDAS